MFAPSARYQSCLMRQVVDAGYCSLHPTPDSLSLVGTFEFSARLDEYRTDDVARGDPDPLTIQTAEWLRDDLENDQDTLYRLDNLEELVG